MHNSASSNPQVVAPECHIAPTGSAGRAERMVEYRHDRDSYDIVAAADAFHQRGQRCDLPAEHLAGQQFGDDAPGAGDEASFPGEKHVVLNEIPLQDQVAVDLDNVFSFAGGNGFVADGRQAETVILVPDMAHGNRRDVLEVLYDIAGAHARSVVRNQDFGGHDGLLHHAVEAKVKRPRPVVSGNDQRYCHRTVKLLVRLGVRG